MKVFISWSGDRSHHLGQAVRDWLPMVLYYAEPWLSQSDIGAGERWANEVGKELETSNFGIICITRDNSGSPWILFEAGALAKSMQEGRVVPLLLDVEFKDVTGPLAQFQAKKADREGIFDIVCAANKFSETRLPDTRLTQLFDALWPHIESKINNIPKSPTTAKHNRPQHEILEELVSGIRGLDLRFRETVENYPRTSSRRHRRDHLFLEEMLTIGDFHPRDPIIILVIGGLLKDDFPWIHDLSIEAYRSIVNKSPRAHDARRRFFAATKNLRRSKFAEAFRDKDTYHILREIDRIIMITGIDDGIDDGSKDFEPVTLRQADRPDDVIG